MADIPVQVIISAVDKASSVLKGIGSTIADQKVEWDKIGLTISGALAAGGLAIANFAQEASKTEAVKGAFENMTRGIVKDTDTYISAMKKASAGTISEYDIIVNANRALSLIGKEAFGDNFTKTFSDATEIIRKASRSTGYDISYLTESFVIGIGRQSKMILDNLGIVTDITGAIKEYGKELGKTEEQMTEQEKKTATLNHVMSLLRDRYSNVQLGAKTVDEQFQELTASFKDARDEIGNKLIPVVSRLMKEIIIPFIQNYGPKIAEILGKLIDGFEKLPDPIQKVSGAFALLGLALGPITLLIKVFEPFIGLFKLLGSVIAGINLSGILGVFGSIGATLAAINPIVWIVVGAVSALAAIGYLLWQNWDLVVQVFNNVVTSVQNMFVNLQTTLTGAWEQITLWFQNFINYIPQFFINVGNFILEGIGFLIGMVIFGMPMLYQAFVDWFNNIWIYISTNIPVWWNNFVVWLQQLVNNTKVWLQQLYSRFVEWGASLWAWLSTEIPRQFNNFIAWISALPGRAYDGLVSLISKVMSIINNTWNNVVNEVSQWPGRLFDWGARMADSFISGFGRIVDALVGKVREGLNRAKAFLEGHSPPKEGPFKDIDKWGYNVGMSYVNSLADAIGNAGGLLGGNINPVLAGVPSSNGVVNSPNINVYIGMYAGSDIEKRQIAEEIWKEIGRSANSIGKTPEELIVDLVK